MSILKLVYKNFENENDLYQILKDSNEENVEIEFDFNTIENIKAEGVYNKGNYHFNGYWEGFIIKPTLTETSLILERRNLKEFVLRLNDIIFNTSNVKQTKVCITKEIMELRAEFNDVTDSEFDTVIQSGFERLLSKGITFEGFNYKLDIEGDNFFISKSLDYEFAVELYSQRNVPRIRVFKINKHLAISNMSITKDICNLLFTCKYSDYYDYFSTANIKESKVFVLKSNEIEDFYGFGDNYFVKLTKAMVNKWWNEDCCDNLVKYSLNFENDCNDFGLRFICWEDVLIETSFYKNHVSKDITQEEFEMICKDRMNSSVAESIRHVINARSTTKEEKLLIEAKLSSLENSIQQIIDSNKNEIILKTAKGAIDEKHHKYLETCSSQKLGETLRNLNTGLDCGFLYFRFADSELDELLAKAIALKLRLCSLKIETPLFVQSTTIQSIMANEICKLVKDKLDIKLNSWTILD